MSVIFEFDPIIVNDLVAISSAYNAALQAAGNSLSAIPNATVIAIVAQITQLLNVLQPLTNSQDSETAANALRLISLLTIISNLLTGEEQVSIQLQVYNPNLYGLAAVFYDDASLYDVIMEASGLLDPQPGFDLYTITIPINNVPQQAPGVAFAP
jgi:hypothetical protein